MFNFRRGQTQTSDLQQYHKPQKSVWGVTYRGKIRAQLSLNLFLCSFTPLISLPNVLPLLSQSLYFYLQQQHNILNFHPKNMLYNSLTTKTLNIVKHFVNCRDSSNKSNNYCWKVGFSQNLLKYFPILL